MKTSMMRTIVAVAAIGGLLAWVAPAAAVPWNPPSGEAAHFTYANGGDLNGLFGNPILDAENDTFHFADAVFQVYAEDGQTSTLGDELSVDVTAKPDWYFSEMRVEAFGSYALSGPDSCANFTGTLTMQELVGENPPPRTWSGPMVTDPVFAFCGPGSGSWTGFAEVDVSYVFPQPRDQIHISLANLLSVTAPIGGSAELDVHYTYLRISLLLIPEPSSLALLALGGLAMIRRRG